ncbi:MAG: DsbA family protein, partial [Pseudomonadota bacterium]
MNDDAAPMEEGAEPPDAGPQSAQLVYFADPMCSWCWGFKPSLLAVLEAYGSRLPLRMIMGGLRAGNTKVMDTEQKTTIRQHWEHVAEASGQPFRYEFFDRDGFVYDTEPACRAIVAGGEIAPDRVIPYLVAVQSGFYQENRDVTDPEVLADLSVDAGMDRDEFLAAFHDPEVA